MSPSLRLVALITLVAALLPAGCAPSRDAGSRPAYRPRLRALTVTTVPLLVKEQTSVLPFLKDELAKGGVLEGKEVYAFSPSTLTVVEGDTIRLTLINAQDDAHSFVLPDLAIPLPPGKVTTATWVAARAGIYEFRCAVQSHLPMMYGQLVVLAPGSAGR